MGTETTGLVVHPKGEQPEIEVWSAVADTYGGRVHVEWDATAPVTPFGQLPFFIEYLKQGGLFDGWVADCPLSLSSPTIAPSSLHLPAHRSQIPIAPYGTAIPCRPAVSSPEPSRTPAARAWGSVLQRQASKKP